jgi:hypothetical protein
LDTGSNSDAELARCEHAYTCGRGLMRRRAAVANTIGVSSTIVASRLSTAVVTAATTNTIASSRRGRRREPAAIDAPSASNRPARRHPSASSSSAARNPTVGPRSLNADRAPLRLIAPVSTTRTAAATATAQSGAHRGRVTAATRHAASATSAIASFTAP